jgi:hypothetical protein
LQAHEDEQGNLQRRMLVLTHTDEKAVNKVFQREASKGVSTVGVWFTHQLMSSPTPRASHPFSPSSAATSAPRPVFWCLLPIQ